MGPGRCRQWKSVESMGKPQLNPLFKHSPEEACASITFATCHPKEAANSDWMHYQQEFCVFFKLLQNLTFQTYPNNQLKHVLELKSNQHPLDYYHFSYERWL